MKNNYLSKSVKALTALLLPFTFSLYTVLAQEAIPASGGEATGSGGSASYSVGQVFYTTITGETGSVAQGVQQPYEISVVSAVEDAMSIDLSIVAYPNPATDYLILKINSSDSNTPSAQPKKFIASLYDINGRMLINKNIEENETSIPVKHIMPGTYFLKVTDRGMDVKVFKIVKR